MTTPQWECLAGLYTQLSIPAGCIYKEGETLQQPNIRFPNTPHTQLGHRTARSLVHHGVRDLGKAGAGMLVLPAALARKRPSAIAFHQGHKLKGDFGATSPDGYTGGSQVNAQSSEQKIHQSLANPHRSALGMGRETQLFADILPRLAVGLIDFF